MSLTGHWLGKSASRLTPRDIPALQPHAPVPRARDSNAPLGHTPVQSQMTSGMRDSVDYFVSWDDLEVGSPGDALASTAGVGLKVTVDAAAYGVDDAGNLNLPAADSDASQHFSEQLTRLSGFHAPFLAPVHVPMPAADVQVTKSLAATDDDGNGGGASPSSKGAGAPAAAGSRALTDALPEALVSHPSCHDLPDDTHAHAGVAVHPNVTRYLVPQSLEKLHEAFDRVIAAVLSRDRCGVVTLLQGRDTSPSQEAALKRRLFGTHHRDSDDDRAAGGLAGAASSAGAADSDGGAYAAAPEWHSRVRVVSRRSHNEFLSLLAASDVVIDTFPYGGATTTYEALLVGTPVVTLPGVQQRSRYSRALLRRMGLSRRLVATSVDDLVARSVAVGAMFAEERRAAEASVRDHGSDASDISGDERSRAADGTRDSGGGGHRQSSSEWVHMDAQLGASWLRRSTAEAARSAVEDTRGALSEWCTLLLRATGNAWREAADAAEAAGEGSGSAAGSGGHGGGSGGPVSGAAAGAGLFDGFSLW